MGVLRGRDRWPPRKNPYDCGQPTARPVTGFLLYFRYWGRGKLPLVCSNLNVWREVLGGMPSVGLGSAGCRRLCTALGLRSSSPRDCEWFKDTVQRTTGLGTLRNIYSTWEGPTHQSEVDIYTLMSALNLAVYICSKGVITHHQR